jgi:hypothetical protein
MMNNTYICYFSMFVEENYSVDLEKMEDFQMISLSFIYVKFYCLLDTYIEKI